MSVGGPNLGTLLIQRIDAALGTTLSQQANLVNGARPDAVSQAAEAAKIDQLQNQVIREPRENVDRALLQNDQHIKQGIEKTKLDAQKGLLTGGKESPSTGTTPSAPTTLGNAARTILSLLTSFPEQPAPVQGKQPLVSPFPEGGRNPSGQGTGGGTTTTPTGGSTAIQQATPSAPPSSAQGPSASGSAVPNATVTNQPNAVIEMALAAQRVSAQAFGQALGNALQSSGLFYESHLADLAFGKMPVQALRQEPQAQLTQASVLRTAQSSPTSEPAATTSINQNQGTPSRAEPGQNNTSNPASSNQLSSTSQGAATQSTTPPGVQPSALVTGPLSKLHPDTHLMVRQQLEVLANQTVSWRGEAWPDAKMDWEIQRREPGNNAEPGQQTHWATRIKLQLPHLGEVDVRINLLDRRVIMHAVAPQSSETLQANRNMLQTSFDASGLVLSQFVINSTSDNDTFDATPGPEVNNG